MSTQTMKIHGQYIKDLSFENPNSPFLASNKTPNINVMVSINTVKLEFGEQEEKVKEEKTELIHEVTLHIEAKANVKDAQEKEEAAFVCDIKYSGIFSIIDDLNYNAEELKKVFFIDAPAFLFPFAREIIARVTSSGGFPPLMLEPIDFKAMYNAQAGQNKN